MAVWKQHTVITVVVITIDYIFYMVHVPVLSLLNIHLIILLNKYFEFPVPLMRDNSEVLCIKEKSDIT